MSDTVDHHAIYLRAESQAGYFTAREAIAAGMDHRTLSYHARPGGRYERVRRGLYRLRHFPSSLHAHVVAAWLPVRDASAVISHETALELHDLSDVMPTTIHISPPRDKRGQRPRRGVRFHTMLHPPDPSELITIHGLPVTMPERTIVDSAEAGTQPDQIELAIWQALRQAMISPRRLRTTAQNHSERVRQLIEQALAEAEACDAPERRR